MGIFRNIFKKREASLNIPNYSQICKTLKADDLRIFEIKKECKDFYLNIGRYEFVSKACGEFPLDLLFALHYRESSKSFKGVLHNGEKILGTGRKTILVPKGRGPFLSWEESAIDALLMKKSIFPEKWTFESKLEFAEKYNGAGYRKTSEFSPYVFAGTNFHDETGKYVSDGKYNPNAPEKQLGVAAILLELKGLIYE